MNELRFQWDDAKAAANVRKHGISFKEAATTFEDDVGKREYDSLHSDDEDRFAWIGLSSRNRLLAVIYTKRDEKIRIISARRATQAEAERYLRRRRR